MKIFIGYDSKHPEAYEVCKASILKHNPLHEVHPLVNKDLREKGLYNRPSHMMESTEFSFTRFLVPLLCNYTGRAIYCDGDFLWRCDPQEIVSHLGNADVAVVKHPKFSIKTKKMKNKPNADYDMKYWSSLMLFDCARSDYLTQWYVSNAHAAHLHGFSWASKIDSIPASYNALVGYYDFGKKYTKAAHFTDGGPWLEGYENVEFADEWFQIKSEISQ